MKNTIFSARLTLCILLVMLTACTPKIHKPGPSITSGFILKNRYISFDGTELPIEAWLPEQSKITSVMIAVHGFNDYKHFFQQPGNFFKEQGIACYAYDQRGFGGSPARGLWSGIDAYTQDLNLFIQLIKQMHPGLPVYLLGESMGGAIVITTLSQAVKSKVDGIILAAPAVWARDTMPWYQQGLLWVLSHTLPWLTLTGEGIKLSPSDNLTMLRELRDDPQVIKETRIETLYGLADLMDTAAQKASQIDSQTLLLYGEKDEIIPKEPTYRFVQQLLQTQESKKTIAFYENSYHMLLRDLHALVLWRDIIAWIKSPSSALPSGADKHAQQLLGKRSKYF